MININELNDSDLQTVSGGIQNEPVLFGTNDLSENRLRMVSTMLRHWEDSTMSVDWGFLNNPFAARTAR